MYTFKPTLWMLLRYGELAFETYATKRAIRAHLIHAATVPDVWNEMTHRRIVREHELYLPRVADALAVIWCTLRRRLLYYLMLCATIGLFAPVNRRIALAVLHVTWISLVIDHALLPILDSTR